MKLAPVVLAYASRPQEAERYAGLSARTTHGAAEAVDACRLFARLLLAALRGEGRTARDRRRTNGRGRRRASRRRGAAGGATRDGLHPKVVAAATSTREPPAVRGGGYVVDALEAALWALRTTSTFEDGVLAAVNLGDDADTTAAILGQLAGAIYGVDGIPARWRERVHRGEEIIALADALYDLNRSRPAIAHFAHLRPSRVIECATPEQVAEALHESGEFAIRSGGHCFAGRSSTDGHADRRQPDGRGATGRRARDDRRRRAARRDLRRAAPSTAARSWPAAGRQSGSPGSRSAAGSASSAASTGSRVTSSSPRRSCSPTGGSCTPTTIPSSSGRCAERAAGASAWSRSSSSGRCRRSARPCSTSSFRERGTSSRSGSGGLRTRPRSSPRACSCSTTAPTCSARTSARRAAAEELLRRFDGSGRIEELEYRAAKQWLADNGPDDGRERPFHRSGFCTQPIDPPLDCKLDFMPLGGALSRIAPDATAFPHRDALFCLHVEAADQATADRAMDALPYVGVYPNFPEPGRPVWDPAYHLGNRERLLAVRDTYDPDGIFSPRAKA